MEQKQSTRIQTSILNAAEKKALVWMASRMPRWVSSDMLTGIGTLGAFVIGLGYALSGKNINFLWLASFGFLLNWFGDSMDGTLARVRNQQRPRYGFFLDHNIDCINEAMMFIGAGLSPFLRLDLALVVFSVYLMLSIYVYISAHLKGEFKLTYGKFGPTEFRLIVVIANTLFIFIKPLGTFVRTYSIFGRPIELHSLDFVAAIILVILIIMYLASLIKDGKEYAAMEPLNKK